MSPCTLLYPDVKLVLGSMAVACPLADFFRGVVCVSMQPVK